MSETTPQPVKQPLQPMPKVPVNYELRRAIAAFTSVPFLLLAITFLTVPAILVGLDVLDIFLGVVLTVVAEAAVIAGALAWGGALRERRWRSILFLDNFKWRHLLYGGLLGLGLFAGLQGLALLLDLAGAPIESSDTSTSIGGVEGWQRYVVLIALVPLLVPIVEELFFRGYIMGFLKSSKLNANWIAITVSSFYFAILHAQGFSTVSDFVLLLWIGLMAVIFALGVLKFKSLYFSIAAHVVYNGVTAVATALGG